jgi:SAM-dependent methyltransferase
MKYIITDNDSEMLLEAARSDNLKAATMIVQQKARGISNGMESKALDLISGFQNWFQEQAIDLDAESLTRLSSYMTLARYEFEVAAGSYWGGFQLSPGIIQRLPSGSYFEIASGNGANLERMLQINRQNSYRAVDLSVGMVNRVKERIGDRVTIYQGDAQRLNEPSNCYDVVLMMNALDRIPNAKKALTEAGRILKYDGTLVLANCKPLQYEKKLVSGLTVEYVSRNQQISSLVEGLSIADCSIEFGIGEEFKNDPLQWNIMTIADGEETLWVDVALGRKIK